MGLSHASSGEGRRLFFVANCMYRNHLAGGDIHFLHMARAASDRATPLTFIGGHAVANQLQEFKIPAEILLSDRQVLPPFSADSLGGQIKLFLDYLLRFTRSIPKLSRIQKTDAVYAVTDYWFDALPTIFSRARAKLMILGMDAPTFGQVVRRGRPDVTASRLPSLYYWMSQAISLRLFRRCRHKVIFYVHPAMKARLQQLGYRDEETVFISNGIDLAAAEAVPPQEKVYDAVWAGRLHVQKGIDDLLFALGYLAREVPGFKAILIGNVKKDLQPRIETLGLGSAVECSGFVSEQEKFRLLKASRVFLMPSHYESWGIVIGEALASDLPVVSYDLEAYREVFGNLVTTVPCFDRSEFARRAKFEILSAREGAKKAGPELAHFKKANDWRTAESIFVETVKKLSETAWSRQD